MKNWNKYHESKPKLGVEVLAQNDLWKTEYNEKGIRIGYQNLSEGSDGEFVSARYNNSHGEYITEDQETPDLWKEIE